MKPPDVFTRMTREGHEQAVVCRDAASGLNAVIAIHSTRLGPALGGIRIWPHKNYEETLTDALRLSKAMTYKAAAAGLDLGGGKAVVMSRLTENLPEKMRALGRFIESLGGRYIAAEDVGMTMANLEHVAETTRHVTGLPEERGGSGDSSILTALGVVQGMRRYLKEAFGDETIGGRTVAIQGLGKVGMRVVALLHKEGARLMVSDLDRLRVREAVERYGARAVPPARIHTVPCDIFSPCALGAALNPGTIPQLRCRIVAGAANNQLLTPSDGDRLHHRGILYAPDYVINAGGLINLADELLPGGYDRRRAEQRVVGIYDRLGRVLDLSKKKRITPARAADRLAEERLGLRG
jgi:leucine dehydrogenase